MNTINDEFQKMLLKAKNLFGESMSGDVHTYAVVVLTEKGCILGTASSVAAMENEQNILDSMTQTEDTVVRKILCLTADGQIDIPSYQMRRNLCLLNSKNREAEVFLQGDNTVVTRKIAETF